MRSFATERVSLDSVSGAAEVHTLSQVLPGAYKVVNALVLRTKALLQGWFREDGIRGQNINMVLTIITINSSL